MESKLKSFEVDEVKYIHVMGEPRYLEDCFYNFEADEEGNVPILNENKLLDFKIDVHSGHIVDWKNGNVARVHYKVCDQCNYLLLNENGDVLFSLNENGLWYVPEFLDFEKESYGDYLIMNIDNKGFIQEFNKDTMRNSLIEFKEKYVDD